jgi:hypothetical protein
MLMMVAIEVTATWTAATWSHSSRLEVTTKWVGRRREWSGLLAGRAERKWCSLCCCLAVVLVVVFVVVVDVLFSVRRPTAPTTAIFRENNAHLGLVKPAGRTDALLAPRGRPTMPSGDNEFK